MKRSLVRALLGIDTRNCPFSDRVTVRYRAAPNKEEQPFVVFPPPRAGVGGPPRPALVLSGHAASLTPY
jgi:hypothetical protein